ncbi:PQQ-binding-like beta-propeller repeat protein [Actinoplanes sp. CA-015351]|uniref:outer membrane protein assembly factor BamB family protein n=1 Tax=Actinoplanes sp. CA-015351 TaxID=3239897 RepID=UPI003D95D721
MAVIDLGEYNVPIEPEPPGPKSEFNPRSVRRMLLAGIVLACALLIGSGAPPAMPLVRDIWSAPITDQDSMTIRTDGVFVFRSTGINQVDLTAYEPATGDVLWSRSSEGNVNWTYQGEEAGLLLIPGDEKFSNIEYDDGSFGQISYGGTTTALDARTGERLWKATGEVQAAASASVLLAERNTDGNFVSVWLADARTGAEIWRRPAGEALHLIIKNEGPAPVLVVLADPTGRTTVLRYADGSVIREKQLPWTPAQPVSGVDTYLTVADDLVMVSRNDPAKARLAAYRTGSLERLWEIEAPSYSYLMECGPILCLADGMTLQGLDPLTGRKVWERAGESSGLMLVGGYILASSNTDPPAQFLVDPATGEQIGAGGVGWPVRYEPFNGSIVLLHRIYGEGPLRDAVDHLDLTTGEVTRVGQLESSADQVEGSRCDAAGRYLACQRTGEVVITSIG